MHSNKCILMGVLKNWNIQMWLVTLKEVLYMHSLKTHFSSLFNSFINRPTVHAFKTAKSQIVCFYSILFLN